MERGVNIDGVLVTWGDRLFYPGNRMLKGNPPPKLTGDALRRRAALIRSRIAATVRRAPQVMVKVTGGGRGMKAIAAHFRYISKNGRLDIEDDRGERIRGAHAVRDLADDWRFSGGLIPEGAAQGGRREAYNIMLSMPRGTDPLAVQRAAREFARVELAGHKYVMVLHDHQANPHVHLSVRTEGRDGRRLNPRKADLHRWRETFAEKLRELGIDAEATRQATRGAVRNYDAIWQTKAREVGRLRRDSSRTKSSPRSSASRAAAVEAWGHLRTALEGSSEGVDMGLAKGIAEMLAGMPAALRGELEMSRSEPMAPLVTRDR
ncbi:relaxase/mobilization nuclease domain-containing protein [Pelomonas nitida]|uniref:Relaxase/mobilization nuclease domain-containing protein n=1 Tax=Pelomonas nitida TaxID=3299027 RepID=A0ABW7G9L8_9BURK